MPHIIVTAECTSGREVAMLAVRAPVRVLEPGQSADQLADRMAAGERMPPNAGGGPTKGWRRAASALSLARGDRPEANSHSAPPLASETEVSGS